MSRSILITGCSTGIGRCAALGMRDRGWRVFATARKPEDIASLKTEGVAAFYLDYTEHASIAAALDSVLDATGGRLDALFNNGAYAQPGALEDMRTDVLRVQFETNFFGWHELTRRVVPVMRQQNSGRIVMNSSILGFMTLGFRGAYNCTKFAIEAYADTLRIELTGSGIHVATIEPGPIRTMIAKTAAKHLRKNIDILHSVHRKYYGRRLASLERGGNTRGELGPEAVLKVLVHACESGRPKLQYQVTQPTRAMGVFKRVAPKRQFQAFLTWATSRT